MRVAVIGAGVVGLATAAVLARRGREVFVLEKAPRPGTGTSARNSEVIHAGLYDEPGWWKARLCVEGRERLYRRAAREGLPHRRTGKLVVAAAEAEVPVLEALLERGLRNGAGALRLLGPAEMRRLEPRVRGVAALLSPESGIVDAEALMASYQAEAERHGAAVVTRAEVVGLDRGGAGWTVRVRLGAGGEEALDCDAVVNAAGLEADRVAALAGLDPDAAGLRTRFWKGEYFTWKCRGPGRPDRLIYPVPGGGGLGVHLTLDLAGGLRLGPDATPVPAPDYRVDPAKAAAFARAAGRYLEGVEAADLAPAYAGVRPRLHGPGEPKRDFLIREESELGAPGLVDLAGIESPGLTAAEAIGERVAELLG